MDVRRVILGAIFILALCLLSREASAQVQKRLKDPAPETVPLRDSSSGLAASRVPATLATVPISGAFLNETGQNTGASEFATPQLVAWLSDMIRRNLPEDYTDDRKWNQQKEVWDGIKFRREGMRIETKRKKKLVNSGTWTRYKISFVDPDETLHIQFHRLEPTPDGKIQFGVTVDSSLDIFGRLSQWVRDVQLISVSANADAACRLTLEGTVQMKMNLLKLPPDLSVLPHVDVARVDLTYYRVRRISQIGGDFAKVLGEGLRKTVDEKIEDLNQKLVGKINTQLEKHRDKLTFSTQDWLQSKLPLPMNSK